MTDIQTELVQVASAGAEPISLADAKAWVRVEFPDDDALIGGLLTAARSWAEMFCRRSLKVGDQYTLTLSRFPYALNAGVPYVDAPFYEEIGNLSGYPFMRPRQFSIEIPRGPVSAINSVTYYDSSGTQQTLAPDGYQLIQGDDTNPLLYPTIQAGNFWPATQYRPDAATVTFTAGGFIAPPVLLAIKLIMADFYANREDGEMKAGTQRKAEMMLWPYRLLEM